MVNTFQGKEIFPEGTFNPDIYIVSESPSAIQGKAGTYLQKITGSLGLSPDNNLRLFSIARNYDTSPENLQESVKFVLADILKTKPKIVIGLGATPAEMLTGKKGKVSSIRGKVDKVNINGHDCHFITTYNPNFILNNAGNTVIMKSFIEDFNKAIAASEGRIDTDAKKDLRVALTADEFEKFVNEEYSKDGETSYDIETNGAIPLSDKAQVVGFSISPNDSVGIYVILEALEYKMPDEDIERCKEILRKFLSERKVIVHNQLYERPYTLNDNWLGLELHDNMDDTMVISRLILGGKTGAGLKYQCQTNLGYTRWSESLDMYLHRFNEIQNNLAPTNAGNMRKEHKVFIDANSIRGLAEGLLEMVKESLSGKDKAGNPKTTDIDATLEIIRDQLENDSTSWTVIKDTLERFKVFDKRQRNVLIASWKMVNLISEFYKEDEYDKIDSLVTESILGRIERNDYSFVSYGLVPIQIIAPYGALDAVATIELKNYYYKYMEEESKTLDLDLFKGYSNWMKHFKMAYIMERNGAYWNEELVHKEREFLESTALESTRILHNSPLMEEFLVEKKTGNFTSYIVTHMPDTISRSKDIFISDIRSKKRSKKKKEVVFSNGAVYDITSREILDLLNEEEYERAKSAWISSMKEEVFDKFSTIKEFKDYFNPGSPSNKVFLDKTWVNDEVRAGKFLLKLKDEVLAQEDFSFDNYPTTDKILLKGVKSILDRVDGVNKLVGDLEEDELLSNPEWADLGEEESVEVEKLDTREGFKEYLELLEKCQLQSPDLIQFFAECLNYHLSGTSEPEIIRLHDTYQIMGIDIEDESTWNEEYKFLYNFRLYKKCMKLVSSYIKGKLGYENAWVVDQETLQSGQDLITRKNKYKTQKNRTKEGQTLILQTSFSPCSAETGRWRAGIHTIPHGSSIKELYTSRFRGGTIAAPDFSQMEVRAMAAAAGDQKLLGAFLRGEDIHRFNAQQIFDKEDVSEIERRFSKMATFSILYGASEYSVARNYFNGNLREAEKLFHNFYSAFPDVKKYIDERHREMELTGKIKLLTNRFINVTPKTMDKMHVEAAKREAQNYPIQGSSSDVAGVVLYEVQKFIEDNDFLSKSFGFIHDSIEIDLHPSEVIQISNQIVPLMNSFPYEEFGVPCEAGLVIGPSMGEEVEVKNIDTNEDFTEATFHVEGYTNEINHLIETWKLAYPTVEVKDVYDEAGNPKVKDEYIPRNELFFPKRAYTRYTGTYREFGEKEIHIVTK